MVYSERRRVHNRESTAMAPDRSKPLHDFTLPCLRWRNQKHLRCMKVQSGGGAAGADRRSPAPRFADSSHSSGSRHNYEGKRLSASKSKLDGGEDGIEAVREKLMLDLKTAAREMKDAILRKGVAQKTPISPPAGEARPWNLRTRRAACKEPLAGVKPEERSDGAASDSPRRRGSPERPKFSVSLSRDEIDDDYAAMLGERPRRRPKKRAKIVQKQLDSLFPGLWLTEVSEDMYKVDELPENGKR